MGSSKPPIHCLWPSPRRWVVMEKMRWLPWPSVPTRKCISTLVGRFLRDSTPTTATSTCRDFGIIRIYGRPRKHHPSTLRRVGTFGKTVCRRRWVVLSTWNQAKEWLSCASWMSLPKHWPRHKKVKLSCRVRPLSAMLALITRAAWPSWPLVSHTWKHRNAIFVNWPWHLPSRLSWSWRRVRAAPWHGLCARSRPPTSVSSWPTHGQARSTVCNRNRFVPYIPQMKWSRPWAITSAGRMFPNILWSLIQAWRCTSTAVHR